MSSRIRSEFGTLAERGARSGIGAIPAVHDPDSAKEPAQRWVLVDGQEQGLLAKWRPDGNGSWEGLVARAGGIDDLYAEWIPAQRLTPHTCR